MNTNEELPFGVLGAAMTAFDNAGGIRLQYAPAWMRSAITAAFAAAPAPAVGGFENQCDDAICPSCERLTHMRHCPACGHNFLIGESTSLFATQGDASRLDHIAREYWHIEPFDMPTGAGDADVGWRVFETRGSAQDVHLVAEVFKDDLRTAIDAAIAAQAGDHK